MLLCSVPHRALLYPEHNFTVKWLVVLWWPTAIYAFPFLCFFQKTFTNMWCGVLLNIYLKLCFACFSVQESCSPSTNARNTRVCGLWPLMRVVEGWCCCWTLGRFGDPSSSGLSCVLHHVLSAHAGLCWSWPGFILGIWTILCSRIKLHFSPQIRILK